MIEPAGTSTTWLLTSYCCTAISRNTGSAAAAKIAALGTSAGATLALLVGAISLTAGTTSTASGTLNISGGTVTVAGNAANHPASEREVVLQPNFDKTYLFASATGEANGGNAADGTFGIEIII